MTYNKFSSKKYDDYTVIVDNEKNVELTLDTVVEILNDYEYIRKIDIKEHNRLHKDIEYVISQKRKKESQLSNLVYLIAFMGVIIFIETLLIILGI